MSPVDWPPYDSAVKHSPSDGTANQKPSSGARAGPIHIPAELLHPLRAAAPIMQKPGEILHQPVELLYKAEDMRAQVMDTFNPISSRGVTRDRHAEVATSLLEESVLKWLVTCQPIRGKAAPSADGGGSRAKVADAAPTKEEEEEEEERTARRANYFMAWLILFLQFCLYVSAFVLAYGVYDASSIYTVSCGRSDAFQCEEVDPTNPLASFSAFLIVLIFTYEDRLVSLLLWNAGLKSAALALSGTLLALYAATFMVLLASIFSGVGNLGVIMGSVAILFLSDLDEKAYRWLSVIQRPRRRLAALLEVIVTATIAAFALYAWEKIKKET